MLVALKAAQGVIRITAYSTEFAEAFRPLIALRAVKALFAITYSYITGMLLMRVRQASLTPGTSINFISRELAMEALVQGLVNFLIPLKFVHFVVHQAQHAVQALGLQGTLKVWGPTLLGLAVVPLLPLLDHPAEHAIEAGFNKCWEPPHGPAAAKAAAKARAEAKAAEMAALVTATHSAAAAVKAAEMEAEAQRAEATKIEAEKVAKAKTAEAAKILLEEEKAHLQAKKGK